MSWLNGKRISRQNSRRLNRLIPINERKVILKRKTDRKSRSGIIAENPKKEKLTNRLTIERSLSIKKRKPFVKTNVRTGVRYLVKPEKNRSNKKTHLGFEIKPNGFSRKTGGYLGSRDGGGGERLRRVAASGERRRGSGGRRRGSSRWRVGRRGDAGGDG